MKKNEKIMIGILLLILIIMVGILVFSKTYANKIGKGNVENKNSSEVQNNVDETSKEIGRIIKANGRLYYDTGKISEVTLRCGTMDGNITSTVQSTEIPGKDGEANFEGARGYQYGEKNTIEVPIENEGWVIFEAKDTESFTIKVYDKGQKPEDKIHKILDKEENDKYDYNIYAYEVNVNIIIDGQEISLRDALLQDKINMDDIIEKANKDFPNTEVYKDGGSKVYHYNLFTIIKLNKLMGLSQSR